MSLSELYVKTKDAVKEYVHAEKALINELCEELIPIIESLDKIYPDIVYEDNERKIYLFSKKARIGVRYCGQFYNVINLNKDSKETAINRISLGYSYYENEDYWGRNFPDDGYFGEKNERPNSGVLMLDWDNFDFLLRQLKVFYYGTSAEKEYDAFYSKSRSGVLYDNFRHTRDAMSGLVEEMDMFFEHSLQQKEFYLKYRKKHFHLFPNKISIRFKGKFHNCLIWDNYGISLGYLKTDRNYIQEENYNHDIYTVKTEFDRYRDNTCYELLHEVALNPYKCNEWEYIKTLEDIIFVAGDNLQNLCADDYINSVDVEYIKTVLTD